MADAAVTLGIDIGGTSIKFALMRAGVLIAESRSTTYARPNADELANALAEGVTPLFEHEYPAAVGLCVPGIVEPREGGGGARVTRSLNVPGLEGVGLRDLLRVCVGVPSDYPMTLASDAHAAAVDFAASRAAAGNALSGRLLALSLGTGVGACVLDGGRALEVSGGGPGHVGAMDVSGGDEVPPRAADGSVGTLEAYMGLPALRSRLGAGKAVGRVGGEGGGQTAQRAEDERAALESLEPGAMPLLALVRAVRIAHAVYRPQHVALLGGVGLALAGRASALRAAVSEGLTTLARKGWTLEAGTTDLHAARGAATLAARALGDLASGARYS